MNICQSTIPHPYVYMCVHKITKEFYIGYREKNVKLGLPSTSDLPKYKTSSKKVKPIFEEFTWKILAEFETGDYAYDFEQELISEHWGDPLLLNENKFINGSKRFKKNVVSEETRHKISKSNTGKSISVETRHKISTMLKGKPKSSDTIIKMCKPKSPEHAAKNRTASLGRTHSEETKRRIRNSHLARSNEEKQITFEKMSAIRTGKVTAYDLILKVVVRIDKTEFDTLKNIRYVGIKSKIAMAERHGI